MDLTQRFILCYRRMIDSSDISPDSAARQLLEILRRIDCPAHRGPPEDGPHITYRRKDS